MIKNYLGRNSKLIVTRGPVSRTTLATVTQGSRKGPLVTITLELRVQVRALFFCQAWPIRPISLQRKCNKLKEHLQDNPSHSSGGVYIVLKTCYFEGVVELNAWSGPSSETQGQIAEGKSKRGKRKWRRRKALQGEKSGLFSPCNAFLRRHFLLPV